MAESRSFQEVDSLVSFPIYYCFDSNASVQLSNLSQSLFKYLPDLHKLAILGPSVGSNACSQGSSGQNAHVCFRYFKLFVCYWNAKYDVSELHYKLKSTDLYARFRWVFQVLLLVEFDDSYYPDICMGTTAKPMKNKLVTNNMKGNYFILAF